MVAQISGSDVPEFMSMIAQFLLFKHGGEMTFTVQELSHVTKEFGAFRIIHNPNTGEITLRTRSTKPDDLYNL